MQNDRKIGCSYREGKHFIPHDSCHVNAVVFVKQRVQLLENRKFAAASTFLSQAMYAAMQSWRLNPNDIN